MRFHGIYKKTLYRLLFAAAIFMALLLCILTGWFLNRQKKSDYIHYLQQSVQIHQSNSIVAASTIIKTINDCAKSTEITKWVNSPTLPEFYFNAIAASRKLQESTTDMLQIEYQCAVTPLTPRDFNGTLIDMVLAPNNSMSSATFCQNQGITKEDYQNITEYFRGNDSPIYIPSYEKETGELSSILYITKNKSTWRPFLFFVTIPRRSIVDYPMAESFFIYDKTGILAYSNSNTQEINNKIYEEHILSTKYITYDHPKMIDGQYLMVTSISPFQWIIALRCPPPSLSAGELLKFGVMAFLTIALCLFFSYRLVEKLYSPMEELLESSSLSERKGSQFNEFEAIRKNMDKITELGTRLRDTMEENNSLMSIQSYKELLFSHHPSENVLKNFQEPDADYCVAIGETLCPQDEYSFQSIAILKGLAYDAMEGRDDLFYINLDYNRYALILRTSSLEDAKASLFSLLRELENNENLTDSDHRIGLSSIHTGLNQLHVCYQEALKILEFSSFHSKSRLITYEEISSIDAVTYSYPLRTENRLIQCVLDGKDEAITIFEDVIRENIRDKDLSHETLQNLIYALIGTVSRIFQELKTTPEEFIGKKVDYKYLYNHWNDSTVLKLIRDILQSVIAMVKQKANTQDQELLQKMLGYIYENYWDDIMLTDLADYLNISPKYCGILFKQLSDNNFKDFLNRYRIERSKEILEQDPSIKIVDLSAMVGFNSSNSFIRVFNKYVGITPGAYLERIQNQKNGREGSGK